MSFVHLNVASAFSAHHGVTRPEALVQGAKAMGFDALAITDQDGLYGAIKHIGACIREGISPIIGVNLEVKNHGRVVILAHGHKQGRGWEAICRIISQAHQHRGKQRDISISLDDLAKLAGESCSILLGPKSRLASLILESSTQALEEIEVWKKAIKDSAELVIEVVNHLTEPGEIASTDHARAMLEFARNQNLKAILSNQVRYLEPDDAITADILDSAKHLEPLGVFIPAPNAQAWLKPIQKMAALALEITEDPKESIKLLSQTSILADSCRLDPVQDCGWGQPKTPEQSALGINENPFEVLWQKSHTAINWRYPDAKASDLALIQHRLSKELIAVNQLGFATYFLTVADVAQMIRDMNVRIAARGSGAGSLINYLLGISWVDPISEGLLFERFLSTERSTLPDIDIDVESARRHEIYRNIFRRYGGDRVTLLSMQSTYRGRGAVRDSGLALGLEDDEIDDIAKNVWRFSARGFRGAMESKPELREFAAKTQLDRKLNLLVDITARLDRLPRHISMHPCGVILGNSRLLSLTPTEPSGMGLPMSQFDKDDMDPMGFLKLDVLGVRMQSAMAYTVREIARVSKKELDLDKIPRDDPETFKMIRSTNTLGMFQIESPGQRELTGKHQPTKFNDLTMQISLFRPGPMKGNMISPYLDGRHGFIQPDYMHKDLRPILEESHGVVVFHEQLMRIMQVMTGCTLAKADELRRQLGKEDKQKKIAEYFVKSALARGYHQDLVKKVWSIIEGFGSFGFCKAHGAAFAVPTYQSAWLKTHFPTEFIAGLLTHDPGMYPRRLLLVEARRLGVKILPIDVNYSSDEYLVEKGNQGFGVRMALGEIASISKPEIERIKKEQPFEDIADFYLRARPSRRTLSNLGLIGALDSLGKINISQGLEHTRGDLMVKIRAISAKPAPKLDENQLSFNLNVLESLPSGNPAPSKKEQLDSEMAITGMDISSHQLEQFQEMLNEMGVIRASELVNLRGNTEVLVAGVRIATQSPPMRSGKRVVFISLDDGTGCADATFFDEAQNRCANLLFNNKLLLISGKTRRTGVRGVSILAENAWDLRQLWDSWLQKAS
ncbi:MAG: DNA polymerase III subunit alpha [Aquiluna sp.]|nr:DNA polymerase III subunit alpha [Aquiluna sp.]MCF8545202.1 DNA polymerase III subunit alpha [Aquiluna sp.]